MKATTFISMIRSYGTVATHNIFSIWVVLFPFNLLANMIFISNFNKSHRGSSVFTCDVYNSRPYTPSLNRPKQSLYSGLKIRDRQRTQKKACLFECIFERPEKSEQTSRSCWSFKGHKMRAGPSFRSGVRPSPSGGGVYCRFDASEYFVYANAYRKSI